MKGYLAAPIFNPHQLSVVQAMWNVMENAGVSTFSPYYASREIWRGRKPADCSPEERRQVLEGNIRNLESPTRLLVSWMGGTENGKTDTGVVWEMAYFHNRVRRNDWIFQEPCNGARRPQWRLANIAYVDPSDKRQAMNLMLAETVDAVVFGLEELYDACGIYKAKGYEELVLKYDPEREMIHEQEPIK